MASEPTDPENWPRALESQPPFARFLGPKFVSISLDRIEAELVVRPELLNRNGLLHGGAILGVCDNLGGTLTFINIDERHSTTTIESKTNFLKSIKLNETARFVAIALHKGRRTMVVQTSVYTEEGKLAAMVTQTQMILPTDDPALKRTE